jgi:hypothetical protein
MIQEIPYGVYDNKNESETKDIESKDIESKEIEMPVSIEVIPHKAIIIYDATAIVNGPSRCHKCLFTFFCSISTIGILFIILGFNNRIIHDRVY